MYNHHIDSFIAVVNCGSFNKAGELLHLTPASLSKHVDDLENILGIKLVIRDSSGVILTPQGNVFFKECQKLIQLSDEIKAHTKGEKEPIVIAYSPFVLVDRFNRICAESSLTNSFRIRIVSFGNSLNHDINGYFNLREVPDISFGIGDTIKNFPKTNFIPLNKTKLTCALPASHPMSHKKKLAMDDLKGETIIFPSGGNIKLAHDFLMKMDETCPTTKIELLPLFYDLELINACAAEKKILVAFDIMGNFHPGMVNLPVDWDFEADYGLIWRKDARQEVQDFMKAFKAALKKEAF